MKTIVIIPARAGSKRIIGKNKQLLGGLPLIIHSIQYAKKNKKIVESIYVTTDDPEIREISIAEGVLVIDRPDHLGDDNATTVSALKHVLQTIGGEVENVILLQPTNPLRPEFLLSDAFQKYNEGNFDSLMTVSRSYKKFGKIENNSFVPINYKMGQRSQDIDPTYYENGLLYITKTSLILKDKILGENNLAFIIEHPFAQIDIDEAEDLKLAEFVLITTPK